MDNIFMLRDHMCARISSGAAEFQLRTRKKENVSRLKDLAELLSSVAQVTNSENLDLQAV
jgi:hypothetical protein